MHILCHAHRARLALAAALTLLLTACGGTAPVVQQTPESTTGSTPINPRVRVERAKGEEIVLYAISLIDTGYKFGGSNPEAGLDCSGMVSYIYAEAAGVRLPHNAAQIARLAAPIKRENLAPGDLVFFNTRGFSFSHVGIYLGDGRFIHAPSSRGRVRIENLSNSYFASRFEGGRSFFVD